MTTQKFEEIKKLKEELDRLNRQKNKLEQALKSCRVEVNIKYNKVGAFPRNDEVMVYNSDFIKEMIVNVLDELNVKIELKQNEFEGL